MTMRPALVLIAAALLAGCASQSKTTSIPIGIGRGINNLQGSPCSGKNKCVPVVLPASDKDS